MNTTECCTICLDNYRIYRSDGMCDRCGSWDDFWQQLTPEQKVQVRRSMDREASDQG